jgi:hypothetical protein
MADALTIIEHMGHIEGIKVGLQLSLLCSCFMALLSTLFSQELDFSILVGAGNNCVEIRVT